MKEGLHNLKIEGFESKSIFKQSVIEKKIHGKFNPKKKLQLFYMAQNAPSLNLKHYKERERERVTRKGSVIFNQ